ncbi:hypothetical protein KBY96_10850 [Cyanobium sp. ATX 6A2]|jgi:hypothetical protein|uniref:hypothetical protein n=1 Tax=Cyanobium sp. ATX 6A2 TaxID=2823700 RepID=UPI0020CE4FBB|nr:hypothetical protein [Cyanobium sp. ATX 6A2]MCP9888421.1 hypothetical protein [Cyanobium sp. ATX 6A2]
MPAPSGTREQHATLDAIQLMLRDLHTRHDDIRHRAAFRGCTGELLDVQQELVDYLLAKKSELMGQSRRDGQSHPSYTAYL